MINSKTQPHSALIDQLRGAAILLVFLFHGLGASFGMDQLGWGNWIRELPGTRTFYLAMPLLFAWMGVPIFFVISGFCIHTSFRKLPNWHSFYRRRFFRIYPPYLVALLIFAFICPVSKIDFVNPGALWQFGSHLLLVHNYSAETFFGINPSFWSIAVEVQLYLLYPFLLWIVRRIGWRNSLLLIGGLEFGLRMLDGLLLTYFGENLPRTISGSPFFYWLSWVLGAWLADRFETQGNSQVPRWMLRAEIWLFLGVVSYVLKPLSSLPFLFFAMMTTSWLAQRLISNGRNHFEFLGIGNHLKNVGLWSYSIYLLHQPMLSYLKGYLTSTNSFLSHPLVRLIASICVWFLVVPVGAGFFRFCEKPSANLGREMPKASST